MVYIVSARPRAEPLLRMLPADGLDLTRAAFSIDGQESYERLRGRVTPAPGNDILQADLDGTSVIKSIHAEVIDAIRVRVESRG
jgi:hypothetical protein